ncbi:MAG: diacylglycerol/polyprenol kinase family protein [Thermoanaerobaculia bacterium]
MIPPEDLPGAAILSGIFLGILVVAEIWKRLGNPKPEWTRKLVHTGGGIACLFFPFLVKSPWTVLLMALPLTVLFVLGGKLGFLKSLHGIQRKSRGAEYYPLAVFLTFVMTQGRPWLYLPAVLVLAVADAFAALIGSRYGVVRYEVEDEHKSLEGSLVFLVLAFLAIHLPVLLMTDLPRPVCVLAALLVAALVTGFEAISLQGADNLFIPIAVVVILAKITGKPLSEVAFQNLSLLAMCLVVGFAVWRMRSFNVGGAITFLLFAYGTWSLGNWYWALPVFVGYAGYLALRRRFTPPEHLIGIRVRTLTRALLPPFVMLVLANGLHDPKTWFAPYLAALAAAVAISLDEGVFRLERFGAPVRALAALGLGALAWALVVLIPWLVKGEGAFRSLLALLGVTMLISLLNVTLELKGEVPVRPREWTAQRFVLTFAAALAVLALQAVGLIPPWDPSWAPRLFG